MPTTTDTESQLIDFRAEQVRAYPQLEYYYDPEKAKKETDVRRRDKQAALERKL